MADSLNGKVVIVTGAAHPKGIGNAIACGFADAGAHVVITDIDGAEGLVACKGLACDVTDMAQVLSMVETVLAEHGQIDILVNNAGVGLGSADFLELTERDWSLSLDVNVRGVANVCQAVIPHMRDRGGCIINIASLAGLGALDSIPACYTASKFATVGLTKQLALQFADQGIRCNAICPGSVVTQMHENSLRLLAEEHGISVEEAQRLEDSHIPLGYSAQPGEIAKAAVFLASDEASYMTGVTLPVAGGMAPGL